MVVSFIVCQTVCRGGSKPVQPTQFASTMDLGRVCPKFPVVKTTQARRHPGPPQHLTSIVMQQVPLLDSRMTSSQLCLLICLAMGTINPFDIPLLNNKISQYLSRTDLTRCVLVSKTWAGWFSPALWRDVDCRNGTPDILALTRQQEHIRIIRRISIRCERAIRLQLADLRLQRLEFKSVVGGAHRTELRVLSVLERIPTLQHLQISLTLDLDHIHQKFIRTLESLTCLESLSLTCPHVVNGMAIQQVLQLCCGLQCLALNLLGREHDIEEEEEQEYRDAKVAIEGMSEMRLCELTIYAEAEVVMDNIFQPLLERCPRMEKLDLKEIRDNPTLQHLDNTLKANKLPKLRHLAVGEHELDDWVDDTLVEVVSVAVCGLESFKCRGDPGGLFFSGPYPVPFLFHEQTGNISHYGIASYAFRSHDWPSVSANRQSRDRRAT